MEIKLFSEINHASLKELTAQVKLAGNRQLLLKINSPGGSVADGLAMANLIASHRPGSSCEIVGLCASMATVIALSTGRVRMCANAIFMIHNPWTETTGDAREHRKTADALDKFAAPILAAYTKKTGRPEAEIQKLMDDETWMNATEAKKLGFIDEIGASSPVASAVAIPEAPALVLSSVEYGRLTPEKRREFLRLGGQFSLTKC